MSILTRHGRASPYIVKDGVEYISLVQCAKEMKKSNTTYFYVSKFAKNIKHKKIGGFIYMSMDDYRDLQDSLEIEKTFKLEVTLFAEWIGRKTNKRNLLEKVKLSEEFTFDTGSAILTYNNSIDIVNKYYKYIPEFLKEYDGSGICLDVLEALNEHIVKKRLQSKKQKRQKFEAENYLYRPKRSTPK